MRVTVDGAAIDVLDEGRGPAVVLLHGFPLAKEIWDAQAAALSRAARVVRPDLRGLGRSAVTPGPVLMQTLAADVAGVLDALGIERAAVVGHSLGTYVAFSFYRLFAERVTAIGLVCGRPDADDAATRERREALASRAESEGIGPVADFYLPRLFAPAAYGSSDAPERVAAMCAATDPRGAAAVLRGMGLRSSSEDILGEIDVPVRVVAGADDGLIPIAVQRSMAAAIPGAAFDVVAGGHMPMLEAPAALTAALERLVADAG
jgi:pimeloyl-ACP methyl ester carboxylesterase